MDVELPDGMVIEGVPDGMSKADLIIKLRNNGYNLSWLGAQAIPKGPGDVQGPAATNPVEDTSKASWWQKMQGGREALGGLAGAALLSPITVPLSAAGREDLAGRFQNAMQPPPTTPVGREYLGNAAQFLGTHGASLIPMAGLAARGTGKSTVRTLADAEAASSVKSFTPQQIGAARANPALEGIVAARDAGLAMPPSAIGGITSKTVEGLSGAAKAEKLLSQKNAPILAGLGKQDVGMSADTPLTRDTVRNVRENAGKAYEPIKAAGELPVTEQFFNDINKAAASYDTAATSFEHRSENPFAKVKAGLIGSVDSNGNVIPRKSFDAASAIEEVKLLRSEADKAYRTGDTSLGRVYRQFSTALDDAINTGLNTKQDPALKNAVATYRDARKTIAKTYLLDEALNSTTGNIDPKVYANALKNGDPLSGPGLQIAKFATQFEKAAQRPEKIGNAGSPTLFDAWTALHTGLGSGVLFSRPLARNALASDFVQNRMAAPARELLAATKRAPDTPLITAEALKNQLNINRLGDLTPNWQTSLGAAGPRPEGIDARGLFPALGDPRVGESRLQGRPQMPVQPGLPGLSDTAISGFGARLGTNAPKPFTDIAEGALPGMKVGPKQSGIQQPWSATAGDAIQRLLAKPTDRAGVELSARIMKILNEPNKGMSVPDQIMTILNDNKGHTLSKQIMAILREYSPDTPSQAVSSILRG
jgi:hypothetical protein